MREMIKPELPRRVYCIFILPEMNARSDAECGRRDSRKVTLAYATVVRRCARSVAFLFQIFFHFQRGHAPGTGGRDRLAVAAVLNVAARENAWNFGKDVLVRDQVAV